MDLDNIDLTKLFLFIQYTIDSLEPRFYEDLESTCKKLHQIPDIDFKKHDDEEIFEIFGEIFTYIERIFKKTAEFSRLVEEESIEVSISNFDDKCSLLNKHIENSSQIVNRFLDVYNNHEKLMTHPVNLITKYYANLYSLQYKYGFYSDLSDLIILIAYFFQNSDDLPNNLIKLKIYVKFANIII
ncbi:MAG: hypothetical protein GF364_07575, partial [Candidatus Lokiarchaeota archaeon]|nr:hypothetical protein [Candidatus Lokiarchaeota archaeon]